MGFTILGTGSALPERSVFNDELSEFLDTSDEWIFTRTGIKSRHVCTTESLDDLAVAASEQALQTSGIHASQLDLAEGYIARGRARHVLVVAAEQMTRALDWTDRATCVLFGDGAGAAVIEAGGENPLAVELSTSPDVETLRVPGLTGSSPYKTAQDRESVLSMNGRRVFKFGVNAICDTVNKLVCDASIAVEGIDHFVFHQANERILSQAVKRLGVPDDRVVRTLRETGNISSACIPLALDRLANTGALHAGDTIALVGFGAGLDVGGYLLRWK